MKQLLGALLLVAPFLPAAEASLAIAVPDPGYKPFEGPFLNQWMNTPSQPGGAYFPPMVVRGTGTTLWFSVQTFSESVNDTLHVSIPGATLNRTSARVEVGVGGWTAVPFRVTVPADHPDSFISLEAWMASGEANPRENRTFGVGLQVIQPLSLAFASPPNLAAASGHVTYGNEGIHVGWRKEFDLVIRAVNHGSTTSSAVPVVVDAWGSVVATGTIPALGPGEARDVNLKRFQLERDLPQFSPGGGYGGAISLELRLRPDVDGRGGGDLFAFRLDDGTLRDLRPAVAYVNFHFGVLAQMTEANLTLGKPSTIRIEVTNWGDTATTSRVDVRAAPKPPAFYGEGSYYRDTFRVSVGPEENTTVDLTFIPRAAGRWQVTVQPFLDVYSPPIQQDVEMWTPLTVTPRDEANILPTGLGVPVRATFTLNSSTDLRGAEVRFAVASLGGDFFPGDVPYTSLITAEDILSVDASSERVDLVGNALVWINATFTPHAAGTFGVIPYVRAGDVSYVGRPLLQQFPGGGPGGREAPMIADGLYASPSGEYPGHYQLIVSSGTVEVLRVWIPVIAVVVGFAGLVVWRRRVVL